MDSSLPVIIRAFLPKVPLIGKTALYHTLGLSEHAKHWDLRTELTINIIRAFLTDPTPQPISKVQHMSLKDPGIKGRVWISKITMPKPEKDELRQALFGAIEGLKRSGDAPGGYKQPEFEPVEAEWTGYRAGATKQSVELKIPEAQKYTELMREASSPVTILYFHGGAYYLMDPASHRPTTKKLAKLTKGRCLSVRYRLAPQNPFPAALLDALSSYLYLLNPPSGSFHIPVDPRHIVFAGDSAGGNLCLALLQTILELRRQKVRFLWNGEERELPLPAGVAVNSPWADITQSSPSCEKNATYDYLPSTNLHPEGREYPPCPIWPANPPRRNLFAEDAVLCHPLVSPLAAKSWVGSCPLWIVTGQELLTDEAKHVAMKAASQSVPVVFEEYEAMPHTFAMILAVPGSRRCFQGWSDFIDAVVKQPKDIKTKGTRFTSQTLEEMDLDVTKLSSFTDDEVMVRMKERVHMMSQRHPDTMSKL